MANIIFRDVEEDEVDDLLDTVMETLGLLGDPIEDGDIV